MLNLQRRRKGWKPDCTAAASSCFAITAASSPPGLVQWVLDMSAISLEPGWEEEGCNSQWRRCSHYELLTFIFGVAAFWPGREGGAEGWIKKLPLSLHSHFCSWCGGLSAGLLYPFFLRQRLKSLQGMRKEYNGQVKSSGMPFCWPEPRRDIVKV